MPCTADCVAPSPSQAHCSVCHTTFGGVSGFDAHRAGGQCADPATITVDGGMHRDGHGIWRRNVDRVHPRAARRTPQTAAEPSLVVGDTPGAPGAAQALSGGRGSTLGTNPPEGTPA